MVFNLREAIGGFKHLGLKWTRPLAKRPDTYFIADYQQRGLLIERFHEVDGRPAICSICGYAMIRLTLPNQWIFETCSAMPVIPSFQSKEFSIWAGNLSSYNADKTQEGATRR